MPKVMVAQSENGTDLRAAGVDQPLEQTARPLRSIAWFAGLVESQLRLPSITSLEWQESLAGNIQEFQMVKIIVTEDQAKAIAAAKEGVEFVDAAGNRLGFFARLFGEDDISIARKRAASDEPRRTTQQVIDRLKTLEQE